MNLDELRAERQRLADEIAAEKETLRAIAKPIIPVWSALKSLRYEIMETYDRNDGPLGSYLLRAMSGNRGRRQELQREMDSLGLQPWFVAAKNQKRNLEDVVRRLESHERKLRRQIKKADVSRETSVD